MEQTWRWYGPEDPVSLSDIRQAGADGIVTALHHIPNGEVWSCEEIQKRREVIAAAGMTWRVVESVPVHEDIKTRSGQFRKWTQNYRQTLINLARCGIRTVCYNFMPVLDWTRTDLAWEMPDGSRALRFDQQAFAAFDLFILQRPGALQEYSEEETRCSAALLKTLSAARKDQLTANIIAGLPGAEEGYTLAEFRRQLDTYKDIGEVQLRNNMVEFLRAIMPECEEYGLQMAVHPDDPPRPILGLPRIVSTRDHITALIEAVPSAANGLTLCTGSLGVRADNDLVSMAEAFAERIFFAHLRSTRRENQSGSFHEDAHLAGDVDMYNVVRTLLQEESKRLSEGSGGLIPVRPDHGHQMIDDLSKQSNPGYSCIGRLKGLAEIRGLEYGLKHAFFPQLL